jgi:hypothetical protein
LKFNKEAEKNDQLVDEYVDIGDISVTSMTDKTFKGSSAAIMSPKNQPFRAFVLHCTLFHVVNAVVLPLTMQLINLNESIDDVDVSHDAQIAFAMSTLCVVLSQAAMVWIVPKARATDIFGRKPGYCFALSVLACRCFILAR